MKVEERTIQDEVRLGAAIKAAYGLSNKRARQAIRTGKVVVDGVRALDPGHLLRPGQTIYLDWAAPNPVKREPYGVKLVYRDAHLLVVDKPARLLSTPTSAQESETALSAARRLCDGGKRPLVVHRLDKDTSGLLIFARGARTARLLRAALDAHEVQRTYHCVTEGQMRPLAGTIASALLRDGGQGRRGSRRGTFVVLSEGSAMPVQSDGPGKWAITHYRTVAQDEGCSALEVSLDTGRTHQIRIHLAEAGCPILGERVYARSGGATRQALHAGRLAFRHPHSGVDLAFHSPWPEDLVKVTPLGSSW